MPVLPGIQPVRTLGAKRAAVKVFVRDEFEHAPSKLLWKVTGYWLCQCWHVDRAGVSVADGWNALALLDETIDALTVAVQWARVRDRATARERLSPWVRRFGRVDIRGSVHCEPSHRMAVFVNPHATLPVDINSVLPIGNMIMNGGQLASPTGGLTDRFAGAFDLLNHGFTVEPVLVAFTAFEGWLRQGLAVALVGERDASRPSGLPSRIRRATFKDCLDVLAKKAGWIPLGVANPDLREDLNTVYDARNQLVHEGVAIQRRQAEWCVDRLAGAAEWLHAQASAAVPPLPPDLLALPTFFIWNPGDPPIDAADAPPTEVSPPTGE